MGLKEEIGDIAWFSLMTHNVEDANTYYKHLFGWEIVDYHIEGVGNAPLYVAADRQFAGPIDMGEMKEIPSHWITYFTVADTDKSAKHASDLGGKVCQEPFDLPKIGRTAIITDPEGVAFHLFTPEDKQADVNIMGEKPGQPCWLEMMVDEPEKTSKFYEQLLGWKVERKDMGGDMPYYLANSGDHMVAGLMKRTEEVQPKVWLPYFMVENLETSSNLAKNAGGQQLFGPMKIPGVGSFSLFKDPTGAISYLFQSENK